MPSDFNAFLITACLLASIASGTAYAQKPDPASVRQEADANPRPPSPALVKRTDDSLQKRRDSTRVYYFTGNFERLKSLDLHTQDTAITGFQSYDILYKQDRFYATLGNYGLEYRRLLPFNNLPASGFDYGIHTFQNYLYQNDSVRYYRVYKTFTELTYTQGAKKEQNFHAVFSRNIYRTFNLGFDFHVITAPGAYNRQKANHVNFVLTGQFFSKNKRYGAIANLTMNRLRNYENGGIKYDSLFEQNLESNRFAIPVNLNYAQNRIRETGFFMKHYFDLSLRGKQGPDSTVAPSRIDLGRLTYAFHYVRQIQNFIDQAADSNFFPPPILDTIRTIDSLTLRTFSNDLTWSNPPMNASNRPRFIQLNAGIRQEYNEVVLHDERSIIRQWVPHARIEFNPFRSVRLEGYGDYVFGDYNANDFSLRAKLSTILGSRDRNVGRVSVTADFISQTPGWFYARYSGNFSKWDTSWLRQGYILGGFSYGYSFFETGVLTGRVSNFVYLDTLSQPQQLTQGFGYLQLYLNANADVWRFKFVPRLVYQTVQGASVLRLPVFMGSLAICFTQPLFNGAATLQPGVSLFYNTSYYADSFNPSTRSFFLQDRKEIGNYLYIDAFINLKIQRARFFLSYTHLNAGFMGRSYYTTPAYPMQDGAFKFGIAWRFHD